MPIKVTCQCGGAFAARDELAGQTVKCPKCGRPLRVPGGQAGPQQKPAASPPTQQRPQQAAPRQPQGPARGGSGLAGLFDEAGLTQQTGPKCPNCRKPVTKPGAVMCVHCGFHFQTGQRLQTTVVDDEGEALPIGQSFGNKQLDRAAVAMEKDAKEQKRMLKGGTPWWVLLITFLLVMTFIITSFLIPSHQALALSGWLLIGIAVIANITCVIFIIVIAFQDKVYHGLGCLLCGLYLLVYAIAHWDECGGFFIGSILSDVIATVGWGVIELAAWTAPDDARMPPVIPEPFLAASVIEYPAESPELSWRPKLA